MEIDMFDFYEVLTYLGIGCLSVLIPFFIGIIYIKNTHLIEDTITNGIINTINDAQNDETLQKNIYTIGAIVGNGISNGTGLKASARGGKLSLNNLIAEIASNWFQNTINKPQSSTPQGISQDLTSKKPSDKW